jgi:hypothetical protein
MFGFPVPDLSHPPLRKSPKLDVFSLAIARIREPRRIRKMRSFLNQGRLVDWDPVNG